MKKVGVLLDKLYVDHDNGMGHPESPERILAIVDMFKETKMLDEVVRIQPRDATKEEISLVHDPRYYDVILSTRGRPRVYLDPDTSTCPVSFDAAVRAAGGMLSGVEGVMRGEVDIAFFDCAPARTSRREKQSYGILYIQQYRRRRSSCY
jgi:Deacetylases, including yeast histone deacetylase and acetoin utilization protein